MVVLKRAADGGAKHHRSAAIGTKTVNYRSSGQVNVLSREQSVYDRLYSNGRWFPTLIEGLLELFVRLIVEFIFEILIDLLIRAVGRGLLVTIRILGWLAGVW